MSSLSEISSQISALQRNYEDLRREIKCLEKSNETDIFSIDQVKEIQNRARDYEEQANEIYQITNTFVLSSIKKTMLDEINIINQKLKKIAPRIELIAKEALRSDSFYTNICELQKLAHELILNLPHYDELLEDIRACRAELLIANLSEDQNAKIEHLDEIIETSIMKRDKELFFSIYKMVYQANRNPEIIYQLRQVIEEIPQKFMQLPYHLREQINLQLEKESYLNLPKLQLALEKTSYFLQVYAREYAFFPQNWCFMNPELINLQSGYSDWEPLDVFEESDVLKDLEWMSL